jgi:C-terminal processing protease CtpA/Prc
LEEKEKKAISQILDSDFKNFIEKQQKGAKSSVRVRLTNKKQNLRYQKDLEKKSKMSNCGKDFYGGVGITHSGFFSPVVSEVAKGYAADRAGVKIGDVILGFFEHSDLTKFIEGPTIKGKEGTGIDLYVKRNEKVIKFSIVREKICYEKNKP